MCFLLKIRKIVSIMSTCTAEEIAEKKRIASEKLKAKKLQIYKQSNKSNDQNGTNKLHHPFAATTTTVPKQTSSSPSLSSASVSASPFYTKRKHNGMHVQLIQAINDNSAKNLSGSEAKHAIQVKTAETTNAQNKASSFLNALKKSQLLEQRQQLQQQQPQPQSPPPPQQQQQHSSRDLVHPYKRPAPTKQIIPATNEKKSLFNDGNIGINAGAGANTLKKLTPLNFLKSVTCKIYMISAIRFEVQPSSYHAQLIEVFKTIPSRSYDNNTKCWNFSLNDYHLLQERMLPLKPDVVIGAIPKAVLNLCNAPQPVIDKSCLMSIESTLVNKLLPFQKDGVCFAISQHGKALICDEMGLGKTYQAIAVAHFYKEDWPLLICTTASARDNWVKELRDLLPSIPLHYIQILSSNQQQYINDAKILITSYSMMERHVTQLMERKYGFLIFDESHSLKNPKAKCTMVADRLSKLAKHVILLSGTPALSRPVELYSQLQMIDRKFMSFTEFTARYCDGKQTKFGWDANGQSNLKELNVILNLKYMIRRTKAEVLQDLAEKSRETVVLDPALIWSNEAVKQSLHEVAKNLESSKGHERDEILLKYYAQTAEVKTKAVCAYIKQLLKESKKFIVFAHHRVMLNAICDCLNKLKTEYIRIDGSTRKEDRGEFIDIFQRRSSCLVAVLSLGACNSGITLTAADLIIFAELTWNPSTLAQAESRAHRIGQQKPVICRYLMAAKTADDHIWQMLKNKQDVLNKAGIFCEDLQNATHTCGPIASQRIENYFTPKKRKIDENSGLNSPGTGRDNNEDIIKKELENIEDFLQDVDDEF